MIIFAGIDELFIPVFLVVFTELICKTMLF